MKRFDRAESNVSGTLAGTMPAGFAVSSLSPRRIDAVMGGLILITGCATLASFTFGIWLIVIAVGSAAAAFLLVRLRRRAVSSASTRLEEVIDVMSQGLMVIDGDGRIETINSRLGEILGWPQDWNPVGESFSSFVSESRARGDYGPREVVPLQFLRDMTDAKLREQIYHETPEDRSVSVASRRRYNGGWVLTFTDFTKSKTDARNLVAARADADAQAKQARAFACKAAEADRAKSAFLAKMSHEIRTPMNGIIGMSEVLDDGTLTADQQLSIDTIRNSAEALVILINDILDLSKIEAGRLELVTAPFDLAALLDEVLRLTGPLAAAKGIELSKHYQIDAPRRFEGDALRVRQVLTNLVGNAVKFTDQGLVKVDVAVTVSGATAQVTIAISDTGIGIPKARVATIFDDFVQADTAENHREHGTGLGLAISARLVRKMKGEIAVESRPGQGSRFTINLKLPIAQEEAPVSESADAGATPARPLNILLAEDNRVNRLVFEKYLEPTEHSLVQAENGEEALAAYHAKRPDVVLMDLSMPVLDGWEATARIREIEAEEHLTPIPIIALTAHAMEDTRAKCLAAGMTDYLPKPVRKEALLAMLARHDSA
ncbi:MAG: ATP-binding protein [Pseudomonadota bacterium]